jgi:hypothetical protein
MMDMVSFRFLKNGEKFCFFLPSLERQYMHTKVLVTVSHLRIYNRAPGRPLHGNEGRLEKIIADFLDWDNDSVIFAGISSFLFKSLKYSGFIRIIP